MAVVPGLPAGAPNPPASNQPNTFPRHFLLSSERLLFETRPSLKMLTTAFLIYALFDALVSGVVFSAASMGGIGAGLFWGGVVFVALLVFGFLVFFLSRYVVYGKTHYAVTDKRIVSATGVWGRKAVAFDHQDIVSVSIEEPFLGFRFFHIGRVMFSVPAFNLGSFSWSGLEDPQDVYDYIMRVREAVMQGRALAGNLIQAGMIGNAVAANLGGLKGCYRCHSTIPGSALFCKYCGARQP